MQALYFDTWTLLWLYFDFTWTFKPMARGASRGLHKNARCFVLGCVGEASPAVAIVAVAQNAKPIPCIQEDCPAAKNIRARSIFFEIPCIMHACPEGWEYLCNDLIFKNPMFLKIPCIKT